MKPSCGTGFDAIALPAALARGQAVSLPFLQQTTLRLVVEPVGAGIPGLEVQGFSLVGTPTTDGDHLLSLSVRGVNGECAPFDLNIPVTVKPVECDDDFDCRHIFSSPCSGSSASCPMTAAFARQCVPTTEGASVCIDEVLTSRECGEGTAFVGVTSVEGRSFTTCVIASGRTCQARLCR